MKYILTIQVDLPTARDDIEARKLANDILNDMGIRRGWESYKIKVQEIHNDKPPRNIPL